METKPQPGLRRVEDALHLIRHCSPLHYSRVIHNLERVWGYLVPNALAHYERSSKACVLDERFVLAETTTPERIAATIIHEATHARLERWGIGYDENMRPRVEAICLRRELAFATCLADSAQLRNAIVRSLQWYTTNARYYSDASFRERTVQGEIEALRYLRTPDWLVRAMPKGQSVISGIRRLIRYVAPQE